MTTPLQGIPTALFFVLLTEFIPSGTPADGVPAAVGLSNFERAFPGGVRTSLISTGRSHRTIPHHALLAEQTSANIHAALGGSLDQARTFCEQLLNAHAAMLGRNDTFWLLSMIFIMTIL